MQRKLAVVVAATALGLTMACQKSGGSGMRLSATSQSGATTLATAGATSVDAGNGITLDRLRLLVRQVEVEGPAACTGPTGPTGPTGATGPMGMGGAMAAILADEGGGGDGGGGQGHDSQGEDGEGGDECEVEAGPFLVDLSGADLASGVHPVSGLDVPAGTYDELKIAIGAVSLAEAGADSALQELATSGDSIVVDGSLDGAPFEFTTSLQVAQKREGTVVVDPTTGANVTLAVDPSGWFKAADGSRLDPTSATDRDAILDNIRASIRVESDDDQDGMDDGDHSGPPGDGGGGTDMRRH